MEERNLPSAVLEFTGAPGLTGTWLVSPMLDPQPFKSGDRTWRVALRLARSYHPFSVQLLKTTHEVYRGTDKPKNFQSRIRLENAAKRENREVDIYMNNPLRYGGLTFYQYQMGRDELDQNRGSSTLQVVRNPGWLTPYVGCAAVGAGLVIQFMLHLAGFISRRRKK
jgi:cytochrome c biogenesis protein ResB